MNETQKRKRSFRGSRRWKEFRHKIHVKFNGRDPITGKKLLKGASCHHLDLNENNYSQLDEEKFIPLNKLTHSTIHWAFTYYKDDPGFIDRLKYWLDRMVEINK